MSLYAYLSIIQILQDYDQRVTVNNAIREQITTAQDKNMLLYQYICIYWYIKCNKFCKLHFI